MMLESLMGQRGAVPVPGEAIEPSKRLEIGRYVLLVGSQGFEVRESSSSWTRWLEWLTGRTDDVKIRLGLFEDRPGTHPIGSIGEVIVSRRRLVGPEVKPTAMRRGWEVRIHGAEGEEVSVFFRFRVEADARRFANALRRELASLRNAVDAPEAPLL